MKEKLDKLKRFFKLHKFKSATIILFPALFAGKGWLPQGTPVFFTDNYHYIWVGAAILLCIYMGYLYFFNTRTNILLNHIGKTLTHQQIQTLTGISKVVFIGLNNVGKTTLINSFFNEKYSKIRTQEISGRIKLLDNGKYICFIDVSGESEEQHYIGIKNADLIVFMMDHSYKTTANFNQKRIEQTKEYISIIGKYMKAEGFLNKPFLFIVNKKDLWSRANNSKEKFIVVIEKELDDILKRTPKKIEYSNSNSYSDSLSPKDIIDEINNILNIKND